MPAVSRLLVLAVLAYAPAALAQLIPFGVLLNPMARTDYTIIRGYEIVVTGTIPSSGKEVTYKTPYPNDIPANKRMVEPILSGDGVHLVAGEGKFKHIPYTQFTEDKAQAAPASRAAFSSDPINISNDADAMDISCDARFAVVVGANSGTPVSLVDRLVSREVSTIALPGRLGRAASIGDDGRTVLVVLDDPVNNTHNSVRRLTIEANGTLTDSGQELSFGTEYVTKVRIAPGSKTAVALVGIPTRIVAFTLPALALRGSVNLTGGTGNAVAFSPTGDKVYARSGRRAAAPDVIEGFAFDPATGTIAQTASPRIANVSGFTGVVYLDPMAISTDGTRIVAAEENATGELPAARVALFDAATGALAETMPAAAPQALSTLRPCSLTTAIEYYHAAFDHYFVTAKPDEIVKLDDGTFAGWARTTYQFKIINAAGADLFAVCRFFSTAFDPKSSHFYTALPAECATVKTKPEWFYEGDVFYVAAPAGDGSCAAGRLPVYRLYNQGQGGAPNHRFTTDLAVRQEMLAKGWIAEGSGIGVTMCVPQ